MNKVHIDFVQVPQPRAEKVATPFDILRCHLCFRFVVSAGTESAQMRTGFVQHAERWVHLAVFRRSQS